MNEEDWEKTLEILRQTDSSRTKRSLLNRLKTVPADEYSVALINYCFDRVSTPKEQTSVKVLCIKLLVSVCRHEPAFVPELRAWLLQPSLADTAGMSAVKRNALKDLNKKHVSLRV